MEKSPENTAANEPSRRVALGAIAKVGAYIAPVTLVVLTSKTSVASP